MCEMDSDAAVMDLLKSQNNVNNTETGTHHTPENMNFHDVDNLLSCINIWKKESNERPKLSKMDMYKNMFPDSYDLPNSMPDNNIQKFNNVVEGLLKLSKPKTDNIQENVENAEHGSDKHLLDGNNMINDLSYPIDLGYDKELIIDKLKDDDVISDRSSDTRFGTDVSDMSNTESNLPIPVNNNVDKSAVDILDSKGKKIDPETIINGQYVVTYSETENTGINDVDYKGINYENDNLRDLIDVDEPEEYEFKDLIGEFIDNENMGIPNELPTSQSESSQVNSQINEKGGDRPLNGMNGNGSQILPEKTTMVHRNLHGEELENEENPIWSMGAREDPVITERDILRYGKSDSNLETLSSIPIETKHEEKDQDMIKDVSVNCQIDQILNTKEHQQPEKVRGVCYCKSDNSWTAWWTEKGKSRKKAFKLSLYGYEEARKRAIEHRLYIEELIPELKEKRTKSSKRKSPSSMNKNANNFTARALNSHNANDNVDSSNSPASINDDGIFKGTRNRSKDKAENQGIYFKDNTWHATWLDARGNRAINSFPVTNELPFLAARSNAINAYTSNSQITGNYGTSGLNNNIGFNNNLGSMNYHNSNNNYNSVNYRNYEMYKRRKYNMDTVSSRIDGVEYFKNLERKLEEEIEKSKPNSNSYYGIQRPLQSSSAEQSNPKIYIQNIHEFKSSGADLANSKNGEAAKDGKLDSHHCQIQLEKSVLDEIERAINNSLGNTSNKKPPSKDLADNQVDTNVSINKEDLMGLNTEKKFENVDALCISHRTSDNYTSINIIPTYVKGPQDTKLLTFVILNS